MKHSSLTAISPLDGRYAEKISGLNLLFSEYGLMRFRIAVEIQWLKSLSHQSPIKELSTLSNPKILNVLNNISQQFNQKDAKRIKAIENKTNHDLKAVEYFLKEKFLKNPELEKISEFIHFACTSEDINNLAYALMLKNARENFLLPILKNLINHLVQFAHQYAAQPMLSRTHGQAATPTTLGKEFANFASRLQRQYEQLIKTPILGKINGAVGNYNAHRIAYPRVNWEKVSKEVVENLELVWNPLTTQIEPHDYIAEYLHIMIRINTILIDFTRDMWSYISLGYFQQKLQKNEVGSSTMPHKINPIDFENAEGNLGLANALFDHMANKLPISRWQRDLTDSTVLRNLGVGFGHSLLAYQAILNGLTKLQVNKARLDTDLEQNKEVLAEAIQTVMRRYGIEKPYEKLKQLTRGQSLSGHVLANFIESLSLPAIVKKELKRLSPSTYLGDAEKLAKSVKKIK